MRLIAWQTVAAVRDPGNGRGCRTTSKSLLSQDFAGKLPRRSSLISRDANGKLEKTRFFVSRNLDVLGACDYLLARSIGDELNRAEEEMLSLRPYTALSTAAARPFNRPSDWRRSRVGMPQHQITGEQGRLPLP